MSSLTTEDADLLSQIISNSNQLEILNLYV